MDKEFAYDLIGVLLSAAMWLFFGWQIAQSKAAGDGYFVARGKYYITQEAGSVKNEPPVLYDPQSNTAYK